MKQSKKNNNSNINSIHKLLNYICISKNEEECNKCKINTFWKNKINTRQITRLFNNVGNIIYGKNSFNFIKNQYTYFYIFDKEDITQIDKATNKTIDSILQSILNNKVLFDKNNTTITPKGLESKLTFSINESYRGFVIQYKNNKNNIDYDIYPLGLTKIKDEYSVIVKNNGNIHLLEKQNKLSNISKNKLDLKELKNTRIFNKFIKTNTVPMINLKHIYNYLLKNNNYLLKNNNNNNNINLLKNSELFIIANWGESQNIKNNYYIGCDSGGPYGISATKSSTKIININTNPPQNYILDTTKKSIHLKTKNIK
jgi:hypothetical protein